MAELTITLPASIYAVNFKRWIFAGNSRPLIDAALTPAGQSR